MDLNVLSLYDLEYLPMSYETAESTVKIIVPDHEEGLGLVVKNNDPMNVARVTVKAGNSIYSVGDLAMNIADSSEMLINLKNTGRYKNVSGEDAGKIVIEISGVSASNISLCAFEL